MWLVLDIHVSSVFACFVGGVYDIKLYIIYSNTKYMQFMYYIIYLKGFEVLVEK